MNQIVVKQDAHDLGIVSPVGCRIRGLDVQIGAPELDGDINKVEKIVNDNLDAILDKPEVKQFHEFFSKIGYPDQTPSGEQLVKIVEKKGLKRRNNVVDAYNIASAEFGVSLGMHDAATLGGDVIIQRASGGERFLPIFHDEYIVAQSGDLVYGTDDHMLALFGEVTRDAEKFRVTDLTNEVLLVARGNRKTSEDYNRAACRRAYDLISKTCPDAEMEFLDVVVESNKKATLA
ncbi:B3/B4 domain-containing protein [Halocatena marina]|uniref:B3/B4 domain-containing protein n=1 Tax=Halocatena marina TaxID=2934937 RepID=UPI00200CED38|nr:B3/4 domain-containing protein [Halocatena marina]